ncbi:MAG: sulfotransferase [Rhodospirillaceae bacterium]|nr:sulfotransferase [Rhodospirillaceae bacterium]
MAAPGADLHRAAQVALNQGRLAEAKRLCEQLIANDPRHADAHFLLGMSEDARGAVSDAVRYVEAAVALAPKAEYLAHLGRLLSKMKRDNDAVTAANRAAALNPTDALTLDTIGCVYSRVGRHADAIGFFERAVAGQAGHAEFRFNLAASLGFLGRFDEAERHYEAIVTAMPHVVKAHAALSALRKQTPAHNHIARLRGLLTSLPPAAHLHIHYALAKELEDIGDHDAAFAHLKAAGDSRKKELGYTIDFDKAIFAALKERFAAPAPSAGHDSDAPVFVVGMPRTGTTLVERIISSHPEVTSAGELQTLPLAVKRATQSRSRFVLDEETIRASLNIDAALLGKSYIEQTRAHRSDSRRFIDKMPLNFLYVGFIAAALPQAKIVCLRRNPMDTCWSNFKHLFATNFSYYNYSYDLMDTGAYYLEFDRLMAHWAKILPGRVLEVRYESLVDDLEGEARRLIGHLGLPWSDACLNFHENDAAVATPSAAQVRQPIYKDSVGKWRRYAGHLAPLTAFFAANGIETGA